MSVNVSVNNSLTIKGISPAAGAGLTLLANPTLLYTNATHGDYFADTFVVNASTPATALNLGDIVTGATIWIQTDKKIDVTLTQNAVDHTFTVDSFLHMETAFTAVKIANNSATNPANITVVIAGERVTNPGTPGIY